MADFGDLPVNLQLTVDSACDQLEATLRDGGPVDRELMAERLPVACREVFFRESQRLIEDYQRRRTLVTGEAGDAALLGNILKGGVLGRFKLLRILGYGGFGVVWLAEDSMPRRQVALKVAYPKVGGAVSLERFRRETDAMALMNHPGIVRIYDCGWIDQLLFICCEYVDGVTLERALREGPRLQPAGAVSLIRELALTLEHAHACGVIHRDVKPANILLTAEGRIKLTDFGLARTMDDRRSLTVEGMVLGTLDYMSPEQASGKGGEATAATDIWSLGVILYQMLTGVLPFQGREAELLARIRDEEPIPLHRLNAAIDPVLETICLKCLSKNPADRYGSARELMDDLDRRSRGERIRARQPGLLARARRFARRRVLSLLAGALAVTALAVIGTGSVAWSLAERTERDRLIGALASGAGETDGLLKRRPDLIPRVRAAIADPALPEVHRLRLLQALPEPDRSERDRLRESLRRAPASEFHALLARVRDLVNEPDEPSAAEALRLHWRGELLADAKRQPGTRPELIRGILSEPEADFRRWLADPDLARAGLAPLAAAELSRIDPLDERRGRLLTMIAGWAGNARAAVDLMLDHAQPEDAPALAELMRVDREVERAIRTRPSDADAGDEADAIAMALLTGLVREASPEALRTAFEHPSAPVRRRLIVRLGRSGFPLELAVKAVESAPTGVGGVLAALGHYPDETLAARRSDLLTLAEKWTGHEDPEASANALWLAGRLSPTPRSATDRLRSITPMRADEAADAGRKWFVDPFGQRFVLVGSEEVEGGRRSVYLGDTEVTAGVFRAHHRIDPAYGAIVFPNPEGKPIHMVSPQEALGFFEALTANSGVSTRIRYRLPTPDEWERAFIRGGDSDLDGVRSQFGVVGRLAPPEVDVAHYPANRLGLHDMVGMVRELCGRGGEPMFPVMGTSYRMDPIRQPESPIATHADRRALNLGFRPVVEVSP